MLEVPYSDDRELVMDILKHGPEVEVLDPPALRERVRELLNETLRALRPRRPVRATSWQVDAASAGPPS